MMILFVESPSQLTLNHNNEEYEHLTSTLSLVKDNPKDYGRVNNL